MQSSDIRHPIFGARCAIGVVQIQILIRRCQKAGDGTCRIGLSLTHNSDSLVGHGQKYACSRQRGIVKEGWDVFTIGEYGGYYIGMALPPYQKGLLNARIGIQNRHLKKFPSSG